jgi:hypothetical protein
LEANDVQKTAYRPAKRLCIRGSNREHEDFKLEFAGKMNFYLSAVDDQLRH